MPDFNRNDTINFLSKLTPRRLWNGIKVLSSYYLSKWTKKAVQWGYPSPYPSSPQPPAISAARNAPADCGPSPGLPACCKTISFTRRSTSYLKNSCTWSFIFRVSPISILLSSIWSAYASSKGIYTATSTNAHYLNDRNARRTVESGLDRLIISIDGTTQDVYEQYRVGGRLEKVLEGARNIVRWKKELKSKTPFVFFQFLVVRPNEHQLDDIRKLAKRSAWTRSALRPHRSMTIKMIPTG
jgi:hypothetical protein